MAFLELQFPPEIAYGAMGGPEYSTDVVELDGGVESRNQNWSAARSRWDVAHGVKTAADYAALLAFFRIAKGRTHGFRFKDWLDFEAVVADGRLGTDAVGTGYPTYQLYKRYANAAGNEDRAIVKPVAGQVTVYRNASPVAVGAGAGEIAISSTTGIVTFVANSSKTITAITRANPGEVTTSAAHGFSTGNLIYLASVLGMTQVNGLAFNITVTAADKFTLGVNTSGYTAYTSGGTAAKYPQAADALTWAGQFDVPARFDVDHMQASREGPADYDWRDIPVIEIRV